MLVWLDAPSLAAVYEFYFYCHNGLQAQRGSLCRQEGPPALLHSGWLGESSRVISDSLSIKSTELTERGGRELTGVDDNCISPAQGENVSKGARSMIEAMHGDREIAVTRMLAARGTRCCTDGWLTAVSALPPPSSPAQMSLTPSMWQT